MDDSDRKPTSAFAGVFIISNAALGAGTLAFPQAFAKSGLYLSVPILVLCATLCGLALAICAFANYETRTVEYYQAMGFYCGPLMEIFFHLTMVTGLIGTCTLYMITVGDQSDQIVDRIWTDPDERADLWYLDRRLIITTLSTIVILPLCLAKNIDFLKWPSSLGVLAMVYLMVVIVIDYCNPNTKESANVDDFPEDFADVFNAFPTILLAYQCMSNAYPVFGGLRQPSVKDYFVTISGSVFICSVIYLPVGLLGYLKYGRDVKSNVLLSYQSDNMILVAQAAVLLAVLVSYPTMFWVAKECLIKMWKSGKEFYLNTIRHRGEAADIEVRTHTPLQRYTIAVVFFVATLGMALGLPDISVAVAFTGSLAAYFYLVCPGLILIQTTYVNEHGQFLQSSRQKRRFEDPSQEMDPENNPGESEEGPQVMIVNQSGLTSDSYEHEELEEHQITDSTDLIDMNRSGFLVNKYRNGVLSWSLRVSGLLFCALGMFVTGLGVVDAVYGLIDIL